VINFVGDLRQVGAVILNFRATQICLLVCFMVFNATFNNMSVISWQSVVINFVGDLRQVGGFLLVLVPPPIKLTATI
jgi:hypothetical protein